MVRAGEATVDGSSVVRFSSRSRTLRYPVHPSPSLHLTIVRDAREDEREAIRRLTLAAYEEYASAMEPAAWAGLDQAVRTALDTEGPVERIVAESGGRIVGSVMLYEPAVDVYAGAIGQMPWPELRLLAVAPEARGQGIGEALVRECARRSRERGATDLGLHTSRSMTPAIRMYERLGFLRAPTYDFHPPNAELVTAYRLPL